MKTARMSIDKVASAIFGNSSIENILFKFHLSSTKYLSDDTQYKFYTNNTSDKLYNF